MQSKIDLSPKVKTLHITPPRISLVLPRSREIRQIDFDESDQLGKNPVVLLSGDHVRAAICRESRERVAEKSQNWSNLARERDEEVLVRIESEAREAALSRFQAENLVNAQYRLQRQQREQARETRRQQSNALELPSSSKSSPHNNLPPEGVPATSKQTQENGPAKVPMSDNSNQDTVVALLDELRKVMQVLTRTISALPSLESATTVESTKEIHKRYRRLCQEASTLAASLASDTAASPENVADLSDCVKKTKALITLAEAAKKNLLEEADRRKQAEQLAVELELDVLQDQPVDVKPVPVPDEKEVISLSPTDRAHRIYETYAQKAKLVRLAFSQLESDPALKTLKSAVLFASSNPVVICSANSPSEIIEPYRKAFLLLRGCEVDTNSVRIRLTDHPEIVHYVRYNMAKKFIDLACMQTEEKNEVKLFALATLITELWSCDFEFGETFLALLYTEYPVLIPYYGKPSLKAEGNVELQLKRLGALSKFYAAIMQTDRTFLLRRLFPTKSFDGKNPHGMEAGWELLSGLVNQDIQLGTTVLVLRNIISVAGWLLKKTYDRQFSKLMLSISRQVLPKIREKTPKELQGPIERLLELLDVFYRTQAVAIPENRLSEDFWNS